MNNNVDKNFSFIKKASRSHLAVFSVRVANLDATTSLTLF